MEDSRIKRFVMGALPMSQQGVSFDVFVELVMLDLFQFDNDNEVEKTDVCRLINELHDEEHLFMFRSGTVAATRKGLDRYG